MSKNDVWKKNINKIIIRSGLSSNIYKATNIETGNYVAIKELNKNKTHSIFVCLMVESFAKNENDERLLL